MRIHIVQKGDTLWEIAKKYNVDFEELKALNSHLASPDMIMPGMKIRIPAPSKKVSPADKKELQPKVQKKEKQKPAPKKEYLQEKSIELPKMPTFPLEQKKTAPVKEKKTKKYPTTILPELPDSKTYEKPKQEPKKDWKPEVMGKTKAPEVKPEMQQPIFMPPMQMPCYPMPVVTYPCHGSYMPVQQMMPDCGCGGSQNMPYFPYGQQPMHQPMQQSMQHSMYQPMYQHQDQQGMMQDPGQFQGSMQEMPQMMNQPYAQANSEMPSFSGPSLQMYPEPPAGMRDQKLEISPAPETHHEEEEENTDH